MNRARLLVVAVVFGVPPTPLQGQDEQRVDRMKQLLREACPGWDAGSIRRMDEVLDARRAAIDGLDSDAFRLLGQGWQDCLKHLVSRTEDRGRIVIEIWKLGWMIDRFGSGDRGTSDVRSESWVMAEKLISVSRDVLAGMPAPYREAEVAALRIRYERSFDNPLYVLGKRALSEQANALLDGYLEEGRSRLQERGLTEVERIGAFIDFLDGFESAWLAAENPEMAEFMVRQIRNSTGPDPSSPPEVDPRRAVQYEVLESRARPSIRRLELELRMLDEVLRLVNR